MEAVRAIEVVAADQVRGPPGPSSATRACDYLPRVTMRASLGIPINQRLAITLRLFIRGAAEARALDQTDVLG
jgi:hypothetical protein